MGSDNQSTLFDNQPPLGPPPGFDPALIPTSATVPIPVGTYGTIGEIKVHCEVCSRCGLGATKINAVIGRGNPQAEVMVIGEGPGQSEDEQGLPFVGRSGQLLDKILASVGFGEEQVYISNAVRCRPPGNRKPTPDEMAACKPYLLEQIRLVNPKILLLTGGTAVQILFTEKRGITQIRGEWRDWKGRFCMPIFHPSYLLRNQSREEGSPKWLTWQDMKTIRAKYDQLCSPSTDVTDF